MKFSAFALRRKLSTPAAPTSIAAILKNVGLSQDEVNIGVYDGKWAASGPVIECLNPATNEPIAQVQTVLDKLVSTNHF